MRDKPKFVIKKLALIWQKISNFQASDVMLLIRTELSVLSYASLCPICTVNTSRCSVK